MRKNAAPVQPIRIVRGTASFDFLSLRDEGTIIRITLQQYVLDTKSNIQYYTSDHGAYGTVFIICYKYETTNFYGLFARKLRCSRCA